MREFTLLSLAVITLGAFLTTPINAATDTTAPVRVETRQTSAPAAELIARILPHHVNQFTLEIIPSDTDVFEIESIGGKIALRGNSPLSLASAFNYYLQNVAHLEYCNYGSNLDIAPNAKLPLPVEKIRRPATLPYRMAYNYCTFGYTMAWWDWSRWEKEIDFLALNGINHPFIITGQEAVWINTFKQYGCTDEEIRHWLGSPAHFPWMFMQNMEDFGGTLPTAFVQKRIELAKKILQRCRELGMQPILQGYYGMLPSTFSKHNPQAKILPQGGWCGFRRPDMLDPTDPMFAKIAKTFLEEQEKLFGRAGYYAGDPFHEGGKSKGVDLADCGERIFNAMKSVDPDAVWIKQCWQSTNEKMLSRIPHDRVIALDLNSESRPYWQNGAFAGKRWTWCLLQNFGGNTDLGGNIPLLTHLFTDALHSPKKGNLYGMGLLPEGWHSTPAIYALQAEFIWRDQPFQTDEWLKHYIHRRYGKVSDNAFSAWDNLCKSVYGISYRNAQTPANAIFMARPLRGNPPKAREWGTTRQQHDPLVLIAAWDNMISAAKEGLATDGFAFDLADVTRQALADSTTKLYELIDQAYKNKDQAALDKYTTAFVEILKDIDTTLATRPEFLLGPWLTDARKWG
ncbi:MAG: alpha-N-acetylglucosaminidase, partial [Puniceicoccales bacterium]|nr:alpha-N-acetylglucosaminidase [Puniceicoccales bacterium]